jgi:Tfp pilus assembly protein PilF
LNAGLRASEQVFSANSPEKSRPNRISKERNMRRTAITLLAGFALVGCGGSDAKNGEAKSAGIPLSIPNPGSDAKLTAKASEQTIDQYSSAVKQLLQRANTAVISGRNGVAIESLSQAIGITPEDPSLFRMRADVYSLQGENANARADFSTAVRLSPNDPDLYNFRGYFVVPEKLRLSAAVGLGHRICVVKIARKDVIQGQNLAI